MAKKIIRAGMIPYIVNDDQVQMMFMVPSDPRYGGEDPQIAKGKVEDDDPSIEHAAIREAKEELGLFVGNIVEQQYVGAFHNGCFHVYIAQVQDQSMFGLPHFETGKVHWLTMEQFNQQGRDVHVPIVKSAHRIIVNGNYND